MPLHCRLDLRNAQRRRYMLSAAVSRINRITVIFCRLLRVKHKLCAARNAVSQPVSQNLSVNHCILWTCFFFLQLTKGGSIARHGLTDANLHYLKVVQVAILGDRHHNLVALQLILDALDCVPHCCGASKEEQHITRLHHLQKTPKKSRAY